LRRHPRRDCSAGCHFRLSRHGGRGWWYEAAASLALLHGNVWIELSGLPPGKLPDYYARFNLGRLAGKFIFGTDWPGVPGIARNARTWPDWACRPRHSPGCWAATRSGSTAGWPADVPAPEAGDNGVARTVR
jgi:Amidohydrolase